MKRAAALLAACLLAVPASAAKKKLAKGSGLWLTSAEQSHSIEFPSGWPYPGKSQSVSPPGLTHLFFLAAPDDSLAVDVAAATPRMSPERYFEIAGAVGAPGSPATATLADKSTFRYRRTKEKQGTKTQYFAQGVLTKKDGRYYVTVTSPRRHPDKKEWTAILGALASLRAAPSTVGGSPAPGLKAGATVVNVGPDGSTLKLEAPWGTQAWGYTRRFATPLHSFARGPLRCEVSLIGEAKASPDELASGLRARYYHDAGRKPGPGESPVTRKRLANGADAHYYLISLPARDDDPRPQWLVEGFFARGTKTYYFIAAAAREELPQAAFESTAEEVLGVIGRMTFPR